MRYMASMILIAVAASTVPAQIPVAPTATKDLYKSSPKVAALFRELVGKVNPAVVRIQGGGKDLYLGAVVEPDGWILTKASDLGSDLTVKFADGKVLKAELLGVQTEYDLAILKVDAKNLPTVNWRNTKESKVGQWVVSVGPQPDPVALGVISVNTRPYKAGDQPPRNASQNAGFLGVGLVEAEGGAKISGVMKGGPAEMAGLLMNDIITHAAGQPVLDNESLINIVQSHKPGEEITLKVLRGEKNLEFKALLAKLPRPIQGNPQDKFGSVLSNRRGGFPSILQHDTIIRPVDCGGPLVDLDGKTVGINISRAGRTESYAIPAEVVQTLLPDLKSGKLAPKKISVSTSSDYKQILREEAKLTAKDGIEKSRPGCYSKSFSVMLAEDAEIVVDLASPDFDAYLLVVSPSGKQIGEDDDSGGDQDARVTFRSGAAGAYRIVVTTCDPNQRGAFTLTVRQKLSK